MPQVERAIDYELVGRTLMHPTQQAILERLREADAPLSPVEFCRGARLPIGSASYHFSVLLRRGWIRRVRAVARRGALEHYYALEATIQRARS